jgi:hypothetical protein
VSVENDRTVTVGSIILLLKQLLDTAGEQYFGGDESPYFFEGLDTGIQCAIECIEVAYPRP